MTYNKTVTFHVGDGAGVHIANSSTPVNAGRRNGVGIGVVVAAVAAVVGSVVGLL